MFNIVFFYLNFGSGFLRNDSLNSSRGEPTRTNKLINGLFPSQLPSSLLHSFCHVCLEKLTRFNRYQNTIDQLFVQDRIYLPTVFNDFHFFNPPTGVIYGSGCKWPKSSYKYLNYRGVFKICTPSDNRKCLIN